MTVTEGGLRWLDILRPLRVKSIDFIESEPEKNQKKTIWKIDKDRKKDIERSERRRMRRHDLLQPTISWWVKMWRQCAYARMASKWIEMNQMDVSDWFLGGIELNRDL